MQKLKVRIYRVIEKGAHGWEYNLVFDYSIMILILLNVLAIILETIPEIYDNYYAYFQAFEIVSVIIFTIEYLLRIYVSDIKYPSGGRLRSAGKFIFSAYGMIDLLAILPFFLPFIFSIDLRFIRVLRLLRFFRVLKLNRYNNSLKLIWAVINEKRAELYTTIFVTFLVLLIASILMFHIEGDVQPDKFPNVVACFWWAIATLTTVGYGDVYPVTALGKVVSAVIAVLGIGLVALPTGLVSAGFMEKIGSRKKTDSNKCPHCGRKL